MTGVQTCALPIYPNLFAAIDAMGYAGWVGCEYKPATTTEAGLGWLAKARAA